MSKDPYKYFRLEADELLGAVSRCLVALDQGQPAAPEVNRIMRALHTLKGAARVVGQARVAEICHAGEATLGAVRAADAVPKSVLVELFACVDAIERALHDLPPGEGVTDGDGAGPGPGGSAAPEPMRSVRIEVAEIDRLVERAAEARAHVAPIARAVRQCGEIGRELRAAAETFATGRRISNVGLRALFDRTVRQLETARRTVTRELERAERELGEAQELGRTMRLVTAGVLFAPLERAAHDAAAALQKPVDFRSRGGGVRVDAHVLEGLRDALLHLVRNAVAHGIEDAATRAAAGKPVRGQVSVVVEQRGHCVRFVCEDDGAGLDLGSIRRAAVTRGVLTPQQAERLDVEGAVRLMFGGGISTATTVTPIAGRGVGLGAVSEITRKLRAEVRASSTASRGLRVEIEAPLSLAAATVLEIAAGGARLAVPLTAIRAVVRIPADQLRPCGPGASVLHAGETLPYLDVESLLRPARPSQGAEASWSIVIIEVGGQRCALGCERIFGTVDLVTKPLPALMGHVPGVAGAAIDQDGEPQLIVDPVGLIELAVAPAPPLGPTARARRRILIVDDSLTARLIQQGLLEAAGYLVDTAGSAEEALDCAARQTYALFVVDLELPGMDGFSFIETTRADPALRAIPAVIVTSRDGAADRRRGEDVGAAAYFVKRDFDHPAMLGQIEALIAS